MTIANVVIEYRIDAPEWVVIVWILLVVGLALTPYLWQRWRQ